MMCDPNVLDAKVTATGSMLRSERSINLASF
ncbi:MAG: hypothetical protein ACD_54C00137G0003 [uncultured bacterium]|nr:MAG: hypothetical protein ACD_54C00137G0003 [uncultured bacterium]